MVATNFSIAASPASARVLAAACLASSRWVYQSDARTDARVNNDSELFRLDPAMADQEPALALEAPDSGDLGGVRSSD